MRRFDRAILALLAALILGAAGCGHAGRDPNFVEVAETDAEMNRAMQRARDSVQAFIQTLQSPKPGQASFLVKRKFEDGEEHEHMWVADVTYDGGQFHGVVGNDPVALSNVKMGDRVAVSPGEISDWMYVENGKLVGGYTIRLLRSRMSPQERAASDREVPYQID